MPLTPDVARQDWGKRGAYETDNELNGKDKSPTQGKEQGPAKADLSLQVLRGTFLTELGQVRPEAAGTSVR